MRRICLPLWLLACTMGGLTRPLAGQWIPVEGELSSHAVGSEARTLREPDRPGPPGVGESVRHTTFGLLLSPGGFTLAGKDVSAGIAAVLGIGGQLWPPPRGCRSWI
jgi:hypothetical protein